MALLPLSVKGGDCIYFSGVMNMKTGSPLDGGSFEPPACCFWFHCPSFPTRPHRLTQTQFYLQQEPSRSRELNSTRLGVGAEADIVGGM